MSIENYSDDELCEAIEQTREHLGETECQHRSEVAFAGDSWPGACLDIQRIRDHLRTLDAEHDRRFPPAPPAAYTVEDIEVDDDESDIPF